MSQFFSTLIRFFQQKYMKSFLVLGGLVLAGVCFGENATGAQYSEADITKNIIEILDLLFGLLALILGPMVILAGWLLSPDWTMGDFFGLRAYFKEVWILVANIVYIIFALMLLYMAVMQIFGGSESEYAFKKKLPSFLVGILLVPFTWLIVSWTLSFSNQAVAAVLSIPMGSIGKMSNTSSGTQDTSMWHKKMLPTEYEFSTNGQSGYGNMKCSDGHRTDNSEIRCISPAEFLTKNQAGPFFIIMIYAYNIFKIQDADIQEITDSNFCRGDGSNAGQYKSAKGCVANLMDIVMKFGLSLIVTVFFAVMLIALCWILLMRAIKLWIYIMLSPLFGLAYFTGKGFGESVGGEGGEAGFGQVGFKQFFQLAMVPVLVSAVLAFGLLFVGVVRDNFHGNVKDPNQKEFCTDQGVGYMVTYCITDESSTEEVKYTSKLIIGTDGSTDPNENANITLNFGNAFSNIIQGAEGASAVSGAVSGGISSVDDIFAHLILTMMALVFMFIGIKAAAEYDAVTKAAFAPFAQLGDSVGKFVAHSPSYLPLPHPAFAAITSPAAIEHAARMINSKITNDNANIGRSLNDFMGGKTGDFNQAVKNLENGAGSLNEVAQSLERMEYKNPKEVRKAILTALDQSPESVKNDADIKAFRAKIESDGNGSDLARNIENSPKAIAKLEVNDRTKGIGRVGTSMGSQAEAASQPFHNATFESDGTIKIGSTGYGVTKDTATGKYTPNLSPEQKTLIKGILPQNFDMNTIDNSQKAEDIFKKVFPGLNVDESRLSWAEKKKMLEALKTSAK